MRDQRKTLWSTRSCCGKPPISDFGINGQPQQYKFGCGRLMSAISMFMYDFIPGISVARQLRWQTVCSDNQPCILLLQCSDPEAWSRPADACCCEVGTLWAPWHSVARHSQGHGRWGQSPWFGIWICNRVGSCPGSLFLHKLLGGRGKARWETAWWEMGGSSTRGLLAGAALHPHRMSQVFNKIRDSHQLRSHNGISLGKPMVHNSQASRHGNWYDWLASAAVIVRVMGLAWGCDGMCAHKMGWTFVHHRDVRSCEALLAGSKGRVQLSSTHAFSHNPWRITQRSSVEHEHALHPWGHPHDRLRQDSSEQRQVRWNFQ